MGTRAKTERRRKRDARKVLRRSDTQQLSRYRSTRHSRARRRRARSFTLRVPSVPSRQSAEAFAGAIPSPHRPLFDGVTRIAGDAGDPGSAARPVSASAAALPPRCMDMETLGADAIGDASPPPSPEPKESEAGRVGDRGGSPANVPFPSGATLRAAGFAAPRGIPSSRSLSSHSRLASLGSRAGRLGFLGAQSA